MREFEYRESKVIPIQVCIVLAFHSNIENSKGTKNMIEQSMKRKIRVVLIKE